MNRGEFMLNLVDPNQKCGECIQFTPESELTGKGGGCQGDCATCPTIEGCSNSSVGECLWPKITNSLTGYWDHRVTSYATCRSVTEDLKSRGLLPSDFMSKLEK